jgi:hypothetical protein
VDESAKQPTDNQASYQEQFESSLPPELRKLMEQTKQREEAAAAAPAAEAQGSKEDTTIDRSGTQPPGDAKDLTQTSLNKKDDELFNGMIN